MDMLVMIYELGGYVLFAGIFMVLGIFIGQWQFRKNLSKIDPIARYYRWAVHFDWTKLATGDSGSKHLEEAWLRIAQRIFKIFCIKQHDYGSDNIGMGGTQGVVLRMSDKVARLWELTGLKTGTSKDAAVSESLEDTLIDVADYGIIGLMVAEGSWPLLDVGDAFGRKALLRFINRELGDLTSEDLVVLTADTMASDLGGEVVA